MENVFIDKSGQKRLILIFLGWGMDATPFRNLRKPGYDILALYDYTGFSPDQEANRLSDMLCRYQEVVVLAWSFGVRTADALLPHAATLPVTHAIAINGTTFHINDNLGIPERIFAGTLANLSPATIRKFERRMFASASDFAAFQAVAPKRSFESRHAELLFFGTLSPERPSSIWDRALAGQSDAIFPYDNMIRAWPNIPVDTIPQAPHFPDLQMIIDKYIINKDLVAERFTDALPTYRQNASVQTRVAQHLWKTASPYMPCPEPGLKMLEIGIGHGLLTELYIQNYSTADITLWDIADIPASQLPKSAKFSQCDAETAIRDLENESVDVILSSSTLQWFNSPLNFLKEVCRVLKHNGIAAISLYGSDTYKEISAITGESLKYLSASYLSSALSSGTQMIECSTTTERERFRSPSDLLRHIKQTGVNAINRGFRQNSMALRIIRNYPLDPDGSASLTYNPIYLIFKKA